MWFFEVTITLLFNSFLKKAIAMNGLLAKLK
jgi:hypothetical protein